MNREPLHLPAPKERATEKLQLLPCNCIHIFKLVFGKRNIHGMQSATEDTSFSTGRGKAALASINDNVRIHLCPLWEKICSKFHQPPSILSGFGLCGAAREPRPAAPAEGLAELAQTTRHLVTAYSSHTASAKSKSDPALQLSPQPTCKPAPGVTGPQQQPQLAEGPRRVPASAAQPAAPDLILLPSPGAARHRPPEHPAPSTATLLADAQGGHADSLHPRLRLL